MRVGEPCDRKIGKVGALREPADGHLGAFLVPRVPEAFVYVIIRVDMRGVTNEFQFVMSGGPEHVAHPLQAVRPDNCINDTTVDGQRHDDLHVVAILTNAHRPMLVSEDVAKAKRANRD